jgi:hypothetical protein
MRLQIEARFKEELVQSAIPQPAPLGKSFFEATGTSSAYSLSRGKFD